MTSQILLNKITFKTTFLLLAAIVTLMVAIISWGGPGSAYAAPADDFDECAAAQLTETRADCTKVPNCPTGQTCGKNSLTSLPQVNAGDGQVKNILKVVFGVAAGVALVSLGISAFNFATVQTDAEKIARARKGVIFSIVGLVIALSAEAIVLTVIDRL